MLPCRIWSFYVKGCVHFTVTIGVGRWDPAPWAGACMPPDKPVPLSMLRERYERVRGDPPNKWASRIPPFNATQSPLNF